MPIIKAAVKYLRQSEKHRAANKQLKRKVKDAMKEFAKLIQDKNKTEAQKKLPEVTSLIDKAAKHNLIHKNNASHKKSRLAKMMA